MKMEKSLFGHILPRIKAEKIFVSFVMRNMFIRDPFQFMLNILRKNIQKNMQNILTEKVKGK